jgi:sarcosine oxidase subunit beta
MSGPTEQRENVKADVAIIGGGIAGLIAGINAGTVAQQNKIPALHDLCLAAVNTWATLDASLGGATHYARNGGYRVACNDEQLEALHRRRTELASLDVECTILEGADVSKQAPWLSNTVKAVSFCGHDGMASPLRARFALSDAYNRSGGRRISSSVNAVESSGSSFRLLTSDHHTVDSDYVLVAAGAWSSEVTKLFDRRVDTTLKVNILSVTERTQPLLNGSVITHAGGRFTLKQFANGSCVLGGGYAGIGSLETNIADIDPNELQQNLQSQCAIVPGLKDLLLVRTWAGFSETAFADSPALDALDDAGRVWVILTGDIGFTLGPLFGRMAAGIICGQSQPKFKNSLRLPRNA